MASSRTSFGDPGHRKISRTCASSFWPNAFGTPGERPKLWPSWTGSPEGTRHSRPVRMRLSSCSSSPPVSREGSPPKGRKTLPPTCRRPTSGAGGWRRSWTWCPRPPGKRQGSPWPRCGLTVPILPFRGSSPNPARSSKRSSEIPPGSLSRGTSGWRFSWPPTGRGWLPMPTGWLTSFAPPLERQLKTP